MKKLVLTIFTFILMITFSVFTISKAKAQTVGDILTGHYTYYDPEGDLEGQSIYQWYRDSSPIDGAISLTYTVTTSDVGHTLYFQVIPVALTGISPGVPIKSSGIYISDPSVVSVGGGGGLISQVVQSGTSIPIITYMIGTSTASTTNLNGNSPLSQLFSFKRTLKLTMKGDDVKALQIYLNTHGYTIVPSGPGSKDHETNIFGYATKAAVIKFQKANKIVPASGIVGPLTIGKIK